MSAIFIKIDGVNGESRDAKHKSWIDALSASYGVTQSSSMPTGGGGGVGKASFNAFSFSHIVDKTSPVLFKLCAAGTHIKKVEVSVCKSGTNLQEYINVVMSDVIVVSVLPNGRNGAEWIESVNLAYSKVEVNVKEQNADGSMGAAVRGAWDVKQNKEC